MVQRFTYLLLLVWIGLTGIATSETVRVAAATNFKPALDVIKSEFEDQTGNRLIVTYGSTGKLYSQIKFGAPFDVFLSADQKRPEALELADIAVSGSRFTYAVGEIVLWTSQDRPLNETSLQDGRITHIAFANPKLAPYGQAAMDVMQSMTISQQVKRVQGENVGQAFAFVQSGAAQVGFISFAQVLALEPGARGSLWKPPSETYSPVKQDAVLLSRAAGNQAAHAFMDYLAGAQAEPVLNRFGYKKALP